MSSQFKKEFFFISNFLSLFRLALVVPISILLMGSTNIERLFAVLIGIVAIVSDGLDGYFARKYNQVTDFGKIVDPLADKILIASVGLICVIKDFVPLWFFVVLITRDLLILMGGLYLKNKKRIVPQSNVLGKVTAAVIAFYLLISILFYPEMYIFRTVFLLIGSFLIIISFVLYSIRFFQILNSKA